MTGFAPSRIMRAREQVETQVREAIFSGVFSRGDKLPSETELADRFGVSRTTIREALRALASQGLIHKVPGAGGGSFVQTVDYQALGTWLSESMDNILRLGTISYEEVVQTRRTLEPPAASLAAVHRTPEELEQIEAVISAEKDVTIEDPSVPKLDVSFHTAVAQASRNRVLCAFVSALHRVTRPVSYLELSPEAGRTTVRQHIAIFEAIADQDPERARSAMERHLDYVESLATPATSEAQDGHSARAPDKSAR